MNTRKLFYIFQTVLYYPNCSTFSPQRFYIYLTVLHFPLRWPNPKTTHSLVLSALKWPSCTRYAIGSNSFSFDLAGHCTTMLCNGHAFYVFSFLHYAFCKLACSLCPPSLIIVTLYAVCSFPFSFFCVVSQYSIYN